MSDKCKCREALNMFAERYGDDGRMACAALAAPCPLEAEIIRCRACGATVMYKRNEKEIEVIHSCTPTKVRERFEGLEAENADLRAKLAAAEAELAA